MTILIGRSRAGSSRSVWAGLGVAAFALAFCPTPARAQTGFEWPELAVHLERYTTAEECLAITARVRDGVEQHSAVWRDTTALTSVEVRAPLAASIVDTARSCATRFVEPQAPLADFSLLLQLYLLAGRDADAATLVARRLRALAPAADQERGAVLDTVVRAYVARADNLSAQPARLAAAEPLVTALGKISSAPWALRLRAYMNLMNAARDAGDTARARLGAKGVLEVVASVPTADRRSQEYSSSALHWSYEALQLLHQGELLDSLRRSTAGYVALQRADWTKTTGERAATMHFPIGETAPAVEGDFWYRRGDSSATRPTKGKIALVTFLDHDFCNKMPVCFTTYSILGRLAQRFPELEITLVTRTRGHISRLAPPPPAVEANTLRAWWLERRRLPGALAVTTTDFWRLPDPDRRRIDRDRANESHYSFGRLWPVGSVNGYVIDRSGTIVFSSSMMERGEEGRLDELLDALFAQQVASR